MMTSEKDVLQMIEAYAAAMGMAESTFGRFAVNDGKLVESLRGGSTITLRTAQKIKSYIENHPIPAATEAAE